jgi:hypothetical protein
MAESKEQMERRQAQAAAAALKRVATGALWIGIAGGVSFLLRYMMIPGLYMLSGWGPLIVRLIGEAILIGGMLALAEAPESWRIPKEMAIFSGLGTLPRPLLYAVNMVLPYLRLDWGFSGFPLTVCVLVDAASFGAIVYLLERAETATGGKPQSPQAMAAYGAAGLMALSGLLDLVGVMPAAIPILPLATAGVGIALYLHARQLSARLSTAPTA